MQGLQSDRQRELCYVYSRQPDNVGMPQSHKIRPSILHGDMQIRRQSIHSEVEWIASLTDMSVFPRLHIDHRSRCCGHVAKIGFVAHFFRIHTGFYVTLAWVCLSIIFIIIWFIPTTNIAVLRKLSGHCSSSYSFLVSAMATRLRFSSFVEETAEWIRI